MKMYLQLSYLFLLVGLITQTIAAPHIENEVTDSITFDESTILNFAASDEEIINTITDFEEDENFPQTTDPNGRSSNDVDALTSLERCLKHGNSSIFDFDLILHIKQQIVASSESSNSVDDSSLSDETEREIEVIFDSIVNALHNTDNSEILDVVNEATNSIVHIISSEKRSNLRQIIRKIATYNTKLMDALLTHNGDADELLQSLNYKIMISAMLKEDPPTSTYLIDFKLSVERAMDRYEERKEFNEAIEVVTSIFKKVKKDITQSLINKNSKIGLPLIEVIDYLTEKVSSIFGLNIPDDAKFGILKCLTEDAVLEIFIRLFMVEFSSEMTY